MSVRRLIQLGFGLTQPRSRGLSFSYVRRRDPGNEAGLFAAGGGGGLQYVLLKMAIKFTKGLLKIQRG